MWSLRSRPADGKIGERTITGAMDDLELACLFTGYGYQIRIVEYGKDSSDAESDAAINYNMAASMDWALSEIRKIQHAARSGKPITKPRWPMIVMRTPKGWTGPRKMNGNAIEGSWRAHQGTSLEREIPSPDLIPQSLYPRLPTTTRSLGYSKNGSPHTSPKRFSTQASLRPSPARTSRIRQRKH